jgi:YesN/AraC family two-component response regulator
MMKTEMTAAPETLNPKIILCDDEQLECDALRRIFSNSPTPVTIAGVVNNGLDAIRLAEESAPDIVFMDIRMPGMSGLDAAHRILADRPDTEVIILSAFSDFSYAQEALRMGVMDYVLKPAEPQALYDALARALERIRAREDNRRQQTMLERRLAEILPTFPGMSGQPDDVIQRAIEYVRMHYRERVSLEKAAAAVALSPAYFSRLFARRTGSNFQRYLVWVRLEAAKYLLKETSLSVAEIAEAVGYTDANHFSVRFRKNVGRTPNQFRKEEGGS